MSEETIIINSLQDFISIFEEKKFSGNFYYRGEPMDYSSMVLKEGMAPIDTRNMASGYRWALQNEKTFDDILWLRKDYYREVGHSLTSKETENFIAYAQHHGLPTELLDITLNPAVALYFACEQNQDKDGFVYLFDNNGYDDDGNSYNKFHKNLHYDLTEPLMLNKPDKQYIRFRWFPGNNDDHVQKDLIEAVNEFVYSLFSDSDYYLELYRIYDMYHLLESRGECRILMFDESTKNILGSDTINKANALLREQLNNSSVDEQINRTLEFIITSSVDMIRYSEGEYFPDLKYLLFKPSIIFDRMRNQDGEFIYQLCLENGKGCINQKVNDSYTFLIPNGAKQKILNQLNSIGINQKFIYPDVDNIAKYTASNYSKSFNKERYPLEHLSFK